MGFLRAGRFGDRSYTDLLLNGVPPELPPALLSALQQRDYTYASTVFACDFQHKIISDNTCASNVFACDFQHRIISGEPRTELTNSNIFYCIPLSLEPENFIGF